MEQRVADCIWNGFGPFLKFFKIGRLTCAVFLVDSIGSHRSPFVMVAVKPDLGQVLKLFVIRNLTRRNMAMIVENRHTGRVLVV